MATTSIKKLKIHLNLLHPQGLPEGIFVKFLKWLLNYGRFIVVFVEIIVLATFITRFKLDSDLADLKEKINAQVPFIESLSSTENIIKTTQFKLSSYSKVSSSALSFVDLLKKIASSTPTDVKFSSINITRSPDLSLQVKIIGNSLSHTQLDQLLKSLKEVASFKEVNLSSISFEQNQVNFIVTGTHQ